MLLHANLNKGSLIYALNFSTWKRSAVRQCFPKARIVFISRVAEVSADAVLLVWGMQWVQQDLANNVTLLRIEDGFLRSVGLGSDLIQPLSWVIDSLGIYYDATQPSELECLLADTPFTPELLERAQRLQARIVSEGITKYNVGNTAWQRPTQAKKVILVPGQVESDASLNYGAPDLRRNIELLKAVRTAEPSAYILYKPHPDVSAGLRAKGAGEDDALHWCDEQVIDVAMADLLNAVDEVHVLTSLAGFEALLRNKAVTCYGLPFYSGWGLTSDKIANPRRNRQLNLAELIAATLILYPLYLSRQSSALISPEQALDELIAWRDQEAGKTPWWREGFRIILRRVVGVR